ncbi:MAG: sulfatase-like hydrolase/transferase [Paracoccus sp. (in: a-proteobacteria)]
MTDHNILFIAADDLCSPSLMQRLYPGLTFPNLSRLAAMGTNFTQGYCTVPICAPARAAMMTGLSPMASGAFELQAGWLEIVRPNQTWLKRLLEAGYVNYTQGKIWHGYAAQPPEVYAELFPDDRPFRFSYYPKGENVGVIDHGGVTKELSGVGYYNTETGESIEAGYYDSWVTSETIRKMEGHDDSRGPFACFTGFKAPHTITDVPERFFTEIPLDGVMLPAEWDGPWPTLPFAPNWITGNWVNDDQPDPSLWSEALVEKVRRSIWSYIVHARWMDEKLGEILDYLETSRHADNTIIVFYSDHGFHLSDHNLWHKYTPYVQACQAPMIISVPGHPAREIDTPVNHTCIGATLLDYAGQPVPAWFMGTSLREMIETGSQDGLPPASVFWFTTSSTAEKIGSEIHYTTVYSDGSTEQFNLSDDPIAKIDIWDAGDAFKSGLRDHAIAAAYDWGMLLVEEAADLSRPSLLQNYLDAQVTSPVAATSFVALGEFNSRGWSPHYTKSWQNRFDKESSRDVVMPAHVTDFAPFAWRFPGGNVNIHANDKSNFLHLNGNKGDVAIDLGAGDDEIGASGVAGPMAVRVYGGKGNDMLRLGERAGAAWGGDGDDTIRGSVLHDELDGGAGDDLIVGGTGYDTIRGGPGDDTIDSGGGYDVIHADGGADVITTGDLADTVIVSRTGRLVTITDLTAEDTVDLSAWAPLGPATAVQDGADVIVTAAMERLLLQNTTLAVAQTAITGVSVNV